jgi:phage shock protein PspC (stress-responsive transcriptional regulator)
LRLGWVVAVLFFGTGLLVYLAMWWIVPREDQVPIDPVVWRKLPNGRHAAPLQRPANDRKLLGVCGALARSWEIDPSLVRLGVLSLATLSLGAVVVVYFVAALFIPSAHRPQAAGPAPVEL